MCHSGRSDSVYLLSSLGPAKHDCIALPNADVDHLTKEGVIQLAFITRQFKNRGRAYLRFL